MTYYYRDHQLTSQPWVQARSMQMFGPAGIWAFLLLVTAGILSTPVQAQPADNEITVRDNWDTSDERAQLGVPVPDAGKRTGGDTVEASGTAPLRRFWKKYRGSSFEESLRYTEKGFTTILFTLPPGDELTRRLKVLEVERFGEYGRIRVGIQDSGGWLFLRKGEDGRWRFTMDERPGLERITSDWITTRVGDLRYHSTDSLTRDQLFEARELDAFLDRTEERVGYSVGTVDYYLAQSDREQLLLMGWTRSVGSGSGRRGLVKVYGTVYNSHELGHVLHNKIGSVHPLLNEGLAEAFEEGPSALLELGRTECRQLSKIAKKGYEALLAPGHFMELLRAGTPIYAYAETLMSYWLEEYGIDRVLELWREGVERPLELPVVISEVTGPPEATNAAVRQHIQKWCGLTE